MRARVEARRGFVQQQQFGIVKQRFGQAQTLLHAATETFDVRGALVRQVGQFQHVIDDRFALIGRDFVSSGEKVEVFPHFHVVVNAEKIGHIADDAAHFERVLGNVDAVHFDAARRRL